MDKVQIVAGGPEAMIDIQVMTQQFDDQTPVKIQS
jgi:hypothetical protein